MHCSSCGVVADAACDCGAPYVPARSIAAKAIKANPGKSDRAIAADIGVGSNTVRRARQGTAPDGAVDEPRIGRDGKTRRMPKRLKDVLQTPTRPLRLRPNMLKATSRVLCPALRMHRHQGCAYTGHLIGSP
jgi:hypothetical protein